MIFSLFTIVLTGLLSAQPAAAWWWWLDKAVIQPPFYDLVGGLWAGLPHTPSTYTVWPVNYLPDRCKLEADEYGLSPYDYEVFDVTYPDCSSAPWTMCRHKDAPVSRADMVEQFGRVPVQARQYVRTIVASPDVNNGYAARAWWYFGDICFYGGGGNSLTIWLHEIGHSVDMNKDIPGAGRPFCSSYQWSNAYEESTSMSDDYAKTNQIENFAQEFVIATFDSVVPGGIPSIQPSWAEVSPMYSTIQSFFGNSVIPGGVCTARIANDVQTCMGPDVPCGQSRMKAPVSHFNGNVPLLELRGAVDGFPEHTGNLSGAHLH